MQPIEGITPQGLWTTAGVLVGLCAVVVLVYKVVEIYRKEKERKKQKTREDAGSDALVQEIRTKIMDDLKPRFDAIEAEIGQVNSKLDNDKGRLDNHERTIASINKVQMDFNDGFSVICLGLIAVLNHELHNGNGDEMQKAMDKLNAYLTHRAS